MKSQDIMHFIDAAFKDALEKLHANKAVRADILQGLIDMQERLRLYNISQATGEDSELRPVYVIMQGIIETAITNAIKEGVCNVVNAYIITPRMPTPLMLKGGKSLDNMDLSDPMLFAYYRHNTLTNFLDAGGKLSAIYACDAQTAMSSKDPEGLANYMSCVERWKGSIMDLPNNKFYMDSFPQHYVGAMYDLGDSWITVQSSQVSQVDKGPQLWAIKFGEHAAERSKEVLRDF